MLLNEEIDAPILLAAFEAGSQTYIAHNPINASLLRQLPKIGTIVPEFCAHNPSQKYVVDEIDAP